VNSQAELDIYGLSLFVTSYFKGKGIFTGPLIIRSDIKVFPNAELRCQFPVEMREQIYTNLMWNEYHIIETEYEEL